MKTAAFHFTLITPCFSGGAEPETRAEIRAPSIRGQLRWWFRTLGGFASLSGRMNPRQQEDMIFGSIAGDEGRAGNLIVRVESPSLVTSRKDGQKLPHADGQELGYANFSDPAYLTFPIQTRERQGEKDGYSGRGVFTGGTFILRLLWRGTASQWDDITALVSIFANFGALGFRSRRAMGALCLNNSPLDLTASLARFASPKALAAFAMTASGSNDAISKLASWLRGWRQHGRTSDHGQKPSPSPPHNPGFDYALRDHDEGLAGLGQPRPTLRPPGHAPKGSPNESFRPAIGLPIIQFFSSLRKTVNWNATADGGRFASPILLRPHFDGTQWRALVIFLDTRQWNYAERVQLASGRLAGTRQVLPDLYNAMRIDTSARMSQFP